MNYLVDLFQNIVFQTVISGVFDLFQNIVFQTVISGVFVFIIGDTIQKFVIQPFYKYKEIIGKIDNKLKFYANIISNPGISSKENTECPNELRQLSCDLEMTYKQLLFKRKNTTTKISDAASRLIKLSNRLGPESRFNNNNYEDIKKIRENLNIPEL